MLISLADLTSSVPISSIYGFGSHIQDRHLYYRRIGVIQHIINRPRQGVDILAVEGGKLADG